jgi:hypothetical protein
MSFVSLDKVWCWCWFGECGGEREEEEEEDGEYVYHCVKKREKIGWGLR